MASDNGRSGSVEAEPNVDSAHGGDIGRREFFIASAAVIGTTALSYARIIGANDRISLGHVGVGNRGRELASIVAGLKESRNVEMPRPAICGRSTANVRCKRLPRCTHVRPGPTDIWKICWT
jgi:hypothetical protein